MAQFGAFEFGAAEFGSPVLTPAGGPSGADSLGVQLTESAAVDHRIVQASDTLSVHLADATVGVNSSGNHARVTQAAREVLRSGGLPNARVTQAAREVLRSGGLPSARVTQTVREVLRRLVKINVAASDTLSVQLTEATASSGRAPAASDTVSVHLLETAAVHPLAYPAADTLRASLLETAIVLTPPLPILAADTLRVALGDAGAARIYTDEVRVTQDYLELVAQPNPDLRVTQSGIDLAYLPDTQNLRVTQDGIEMAWVWSPHLRVTQDYIELLVQIAPLPPNARYYAYIGALGLQ